MGDHRSGTTLLENILAQLKGTITVGELRLLSDHYQKSGPGEKWQWQCSCGKDIGRCSFWQKIVAPSANDVMVNTKISKKSTCEEIRSFTCLYHRIFSHVTDSLLIDSSKNIDQGILLKRKLKDELDIYIVTRNFLDVAASKYFHAKHKGIYKNALILIFVSIWTQIQLYTLVLFRKGTHVRYCDLVNRNSRNALIQSISSRYNLCVQKTPTTFVNANIFHSIAGTPSRFQTKPIKFSTKRYSFIRDIVKF